ncbi:MAG: type VII secretion protein EssC [Bacilli bacterium]|nr:type VII secretion protein EssC [Bacilli bacterium]
MKILVLKKDKMISTTLPNTIYGDFQIKDIDESGNFEELLTIREYNGRWVLTNTNDTDIIVNGNKVYSVFLANYFCCEIINKKLNNKYLLYCLPNFEVTNLFQVNDASILIGNQNSDIIYQNPLLGNYNINIYYDKAWFIEVLNEGEYVYLNGKSVTKERLYNGDIIFVLGLRIVVLGNFMIINNPLNMVKINNQKLKIFNLMEVANQSEVEEDSDIYKEDDYFFRNPRFKRNLLNENFTIDSPPENQDPEATPVLLTMASSLTLAASSSVSLYSVVSRLNEGATLKEVLPTLIITAVMLISSLIIPIITRVYEKHRNKKREKLRQEKYTKYIESRNTEINNKIEEQKAILVENNTTNDKCYEIITNKETALWERKIIHDDFLNLRIGIGDVDAKIEINYEKEKFTLAEDNLKQLLFDMAGSPKKIKEVPVSISLTEKPVLAITSNKRNGDIFLNNLILQMIARHSYQDLKIVILTTIDNQNNFDYLKLTPFVFNDERTFRFFATCKEEIDQVGHYLLNEFMNRKYGDKENSNVSTDDYKSYSPYYVIITDNYKNIRNLPIFEKIFKETINYGFSVIASDINLRRLPDDAKVFININDSEGLMLESDLTSGVRQEFLVDLKEYNMKLLTEKISNVPIELLKGKFKLPEVYTFLEMYNVGRVEQLNVMSRWRESNPINSLSVPVGIGENGDFISLDVHEKVHGPHGLIAGMTGSGKSEFIITYILSMAINFHPYEVSFVLIDYKGGGLAYAFENKDTGLKLPHLAGTITNLDQAEITRALASLNSELRRRQKIFNEVRDKLNESTIDIYKYQRLYRSGQVNIPLSHLIIISDEFAELKMQQPEFMDELMSIARIGRSLGVHLILATQKPSGIVNDQIWSNSRFKVCLKVQDRSDSMDMLKRPDAASITNIGSFYLQVGFNEFFYFGQSAWTGAPYYPSDFRIKKVDSGIDFINNYGAIYKTIKNNKKTFVKSSGEEITNIIKYLDDVADKENITVESLWLGKIPNIIKVDALKSKYNYQRNYLINPIIGEYDDPENLSQHLLTLSISELGNTLIYGIPGSGKELVLTTTVYSCATTYTPEEVNFYILDFASETMQNLRNIPHVGDVILSNDKEKLENLFKLINTYLEQRKSLFLNYAGSINEYIKATGKIIPSIIVMINGFDSFAEMYPDYVELLVKYTRETPRFGIYFMLTASGVNSVRFKLSQNFKIVLGLELNDKTDYYSIIGKTTLIPTKAVGRGLTRIGESIYEFQTAHPSKKEDSSLFFKDLAVKLNEQYSTKALKIPVLPNKVTMKLFDNIKLDNMPIGIYKDNLETCLYNFKKSFFNKITASDIDNTLSFTKELLNELNSLHNVKTYLFDSTDSIKENYLNISKFNNNFDEVLNSSFDSLNKILEENNSSKYQPMLFVIYNFNHFKSKVSIDLGEMLLNLYKINDQINIINFIVIDMIDNFKNIEYETWFKTISDPSNAIWIGEGINNQFSIKLSRSSDRSLQTPITNDFGYIVVNGKHALIKVLEFDDNNLDQVNQEIKDKSDNNIEEL